MYGTGDGTCPPGPLPSPPPPSAGLDDGITSSCGQQYSSGGEPYSIETVLSLAPKLQSGSSADRFLQTTGGVSLSLLLGDGRFPPGPLPPPLPLPPPPASAGLGDGTTPSVASTSPPFLSSSVNDGPGAGPSAPPGGAGLGDIATEFFGRCLTGAFASKGRL